MPAPLAKGLIIAASVLVAAGIAIYESPQVRQWVDQSRRKIAIALNSLGDDTRPRRSSESSDEYDARTRREELIRKNRNRLIRKAKEDGIAVDLDELAKIGAESVEMAERRSRADGSKSFDDLVGSDGMLRASGKDSSNSRLKKRGAAGFAAGSAAAASMANPFSDDNVLFDVGEDDDDDNDEAPSPQPFTYMENEARESSTTTAKPDTISDLSPIVTTNNSDFPALPITDSTPKNETEIEPEQQSSQSPHSEVPIDEPNTAAQSFYSLTSTTSATQDDAPQAQFFDNDDDHLSTGTLTPRSQHSRSNSSSIHSLISLPTADHDTDINQDTRSEVFSENDWTDGNISESGDDTQPGIMTPNSWTDVGSDAGDDDDEEGSGWGGGHTLG